MREFFNLSSVQKNILIASIMADGEITKLYANSRRKNNSYREHYGIQQEEYRKWKQAFFPKLFYLTPKSHTLRSGSHPLFTELYPFFYSETGVKKVPEPLLSYCDSPYFLAVLYMDDGTLSISKRINHKKKLIYLTPHIFLYVQNFPVNELQLLKEHIHRQFGIEFTIAKRPDGHGAVLRFTAVEKTLHFLTYISQCSKHCTSMRYKLDWDWRLEVEKEKYKKEFPTYEVLTSSPKRNKIYTQEEIETLISFKKQGMSYRLISQKMGRSYWSVVNKFAELRKNNLI